jgi:hypothetical protein
VINDRRRIESSSKGVRGGLVGVPNSVDVSSCCSLKNFSVPGLHDNLRSWVSQNYKILRLGSRVSWRNLRGEQCHKSVKNEHDTTSRVLPDRLMNRLGAIYEFYSTKSRPKCCIKS